MGVRVTPQGDSINSFPVAVAANVQTFPSVVFNGTDYIAVWSDSRLGHYYINTVRITPAGMIPGPYYWIGLSGAQDEDDPDIAYNGTHCLCVWSEEYYGLRGRFIDDLGQPEDTVFTIAPYVITSYTTPAIASDGNNFFVVWYERSSGGDWDIFGQLVSSDGVLIGAQIPIATGGNAQYDCDIVFDGINYFVVYRETNYYIYGRRIDVSGNPIGSPIPISQSGSIYRYQPTLVNSTENYLIVWSELRGSYFDVYGNVDIIPISIEETADDRSNFPVLLTPSLSRGKCHFKYSVDRDTKVIISLYNINGRHVRYLVNSIKKSGNYAIDFDVRSLAAGVYFINISSGNGIICRKFVILK